MTPELKMTRLQSQKFDFGSLLFHHDLVVEFDTQLQYKSRVTVPTSTFG